MKTVLDFYTSQYYVMVYPSLVEARQANARDRGVSQSISLAGESETLAKYWVGACGNEGVSFACSNSLLLFLEQEDFLVKVITEDGLVGWIWTADWMNLKKVETL